MKKITMISLIVAILVNLNLANISNVHAKDSRVGFIVYDALIYNGKPDMAKLGIEKLTLLNHVHLWGKDKNREDVPNKNKISAYLNSRKIEDLVVVNVEHWPLDDVASISESIRKYSETITTVKALIGKKKIGIYSMFPQRNYWAAQKKHNSKRYIDWQNKNDKLKEIAAQSDIIMPSLYTYYPDKHGWIRYAKEQIAESRRLYPNKPVYVFLWPQYHYSNRLHGGDYIDGEFWRLQLETAHQDADGIIIWGGWDDERGQRLEWSNDLDWWKETKRFVSILNKAE